MCIEVHCTVCTVHSVHTWGKFLMGGLGPPGHIYTLSIRPFSCVVPLKLRRVREGVFTCPAGC